MSFWEEVVNFVHAEVQRVMHRSSRRTPVVADSYDAQTHSFKFKLMPESGGNNQPVITGWIPLHTLQTGNKFGFYSPPYIGDHGWIEFSDDDREGGTFTHAVFNDQFPPDPNIQPGELKYRHRKGAFIYFDKDGNITIQGLNNTNNNGGVNNAGSGTTQTGTSQDNSKQTIILNKDGSVLVQDKSGNGSLKFDGNGNLVIKCANWQVDASGTMTMIASGDAGFKGGGNVVVKGGGKLGLEAGSEVVVQDGAGDVSDGSVTAPGSNPSLPPFQTP